MTKVLKVIKPFYVMEAGDTLQLSQDGSKYESVYEEHHDMSDDDNHNAYSHYESNFSISLEYAKILIESGYLSEVKESAKKNVDNTFVNIFDEIDNMLDTYNEDLDTIVEDMKDEPTIMALEKETVLRNMIKVLEHLKSLKK